MRTSEERVKELHRRMRNRNLRRYRLQSAAAAAVCLTFTAAIALIIAGTPVQSVGMGSGGVSASMFADHAAFGYIVVALLAFCIGVLFTVFCYRKRRHLEEEEDVREL